MANEHFDLISIGSGSAGRRVAVAMHNAGWKTAIVEKDVEHHFGGTCICTGCIPTKALIEKVRMTEDFDQARAHKKKIVDRIRSGTLRSFEERRGGRVLRGLGSLVDKNTVKVTKEDGSEEKYTADIIVLATGSYSFIPPVEGLRESNYKTSKEILELETVPRRLLIIGAGRIGLEFGQLFLNLGSEVTVFEGFPHIFANAEDYEMSDTIQEFLEKKGMKILTGKFVDKVSESKKDDGSSEFTVSLLDGPHKGDYTGDVLLVATGRRPNIKGLNLDVAGVKTERGTILVDKYLQTSQEGIFAIGDVRGNPMFTNWASYQSGVLLKNFKKSKNDKSKWSPVPDKVLPRIAFVQPEFASVGMTEEQAREKYGDQVVTYKYRNKWLGKSMIVDDWDGILKGVGRKGSDEILGAHLWGERTGSLIQMIVLAMENGLGWSKLNDLVYGHPVLAEGIYSLAGNMKGLTQK